MDGLEGIMLSEISQTKTNTVWSHLYVESLKNKTMLIDTGTDWWLPEMAEAGGWWLVVGGQMSEGHQKVQTSNYKISKSWGCNIQHGDYS